MPDRPTWTQPLCASCYAAFCLGTGRAPREAHRVIGTNGEPCCVCGEPTTIYVRIDPKLTAGLQLARRSETPPARGTEGVS